MAQIPVSDETYQRLHLSKAKSVIAKEGASVTWDDIISAQLDVCQTFSNNFIEAVKGKAGKTRTMEVITVEDEKDLDSTAEIKESLSKGEKVTSEQLEKVNPPVRMKE